MSDAETTPVQSVERNERLRELLMKYVKESAARARTLAMLETLIEINAPLLAEDTEYTESEVNLIVVELEWTGIARGLLLAAGVEDDTIKALPGTEDRHATLAKADALERGRGIA